MTTIDFNDSPVIAAVRTYDDFKRALAANINTVFLLSSNILNLERYVNEAHEAGKNLFVHMDFIDGISKDSAGVAYVATKNIDGIISTRSSIVKYASEKGIPTVQRFFMVDSRSVDTAIDAMRSSRPTMIEIMPAIAYKTISKVKKNTNIPIIV